MRDRCPTKLLAINPDTSALRLDVNHSLSEITAQLQCVLDINARTTLPWGDGQFDCVFNTAAIEYLTCSLEVLAEVRRVLRPDDVFAITFSDRWFPPIAIRLWSQLHPFECLGLVLSLLLQAGFVDLQTETLRGIKRPADDKYANRREFSGPLFAVWGRKP